ncbi:hypothetical protein CUR178_07901 [Leishmania enriettii]|uniref:Surface antigen-like protein n=1 Tax=Leishmania enriettii TaxID=5663 RepID=A0A836H823_LEIEN|nr:hypothetical protein CUR178_07901 [Leishmania enriettii]
MPVFPLRSRLHKRGATAVLLVLVVAVAAAVTVSAQTIEDFPPVACDNTVSNCLECRKAGLLTLCSKCERGYSIAVTPTDPTEFGKCRLYDPSTCTLSNCLRCAADDNTKCVECPVGYPSISTYLCEDNTAAPTTTTVTEPPATEPPATEPPATEPPATEPPATEPPATEPPATEPPATEPPATSNSTTAPTSTTSTSAPTNNCQVPSCLSCVAGNMYTCSVCERGLLLMPSGQCMAPGSCSVANCAQCYPIDNNRCSSCNFGYALTASYACAPRRTGSAAAAPMSVVMALVIMAATFVAAYTA